MRLKSLDALRGLDMLFLCGLSAVCRGFCKLFPEGEEWAFYSQFEHVRWEGLHFEDLIFPFFIFIAGAAFPFSYARQVEKGMTPKAIHRKILVRLVALVLLGYVYNGHLLGGNYGRFHWWSVLGIIGFAWATVALCYVHFRAKARLAITVALLAGYWTLLQFTAPDAPPGAGPVSPAGNMMGYFKRQVCDYWVLLSVVGYSSTRLFGWLANLCPTPDFVIACGQVLIVWTVLWYLHRNRTFLKV